jgi:aromatic ring-opening dioxygenase LigB subunit
MLKKLNHPIFAVLILMVSITIFSSCAKPPTEELAQAEKAIEEAKQKEADLYAQDLFLKAQDSLKKAKDLVTAKKYDEAKKAAEEAANFAKQAIPLVEQNKAKMKAECEQLAQDVQKALEELRAHVAKSGRLMAPNEARLVNEMIKKWGTDLASIKEMIQGQKFQQASDQLKAMKENILKQKERLTPLPPEKAKEK